MTNNKPQSSCLSPYEVLYEVNVLRRDRGGLEYFGTYKRCK